MKSKILDRETPFEPVALELIFETQDEINTFYKVLNYSPICEAARDLGLSLSEIRPPLRDLTTSGDISEFRNLLISSMKSHGSI